MKTFGLNGFAPGINRMTRCWTVFLRQAEPRPLGPGDHQPDDGSDGGESGKTEGEPQPEQPVIALRQRLSRNGRGLSQPPQLHLHPHHGEPEQTSQDAEHNRQHDPALGERIAYGIGQRHARDGLGHHCRRGEQEVGNHHDARHGGDGRNIAGEMRHQHEESDSGPRSQQHRGTDEMQVLEDDVECHRSSSTASATRCRTTMGKILRKGPRGSAHRSDRRMLPVTM